MKFMYRYLTICLIGVLALGAFLTADSGGVLPDLAPVILVAVIILGGSMTVAFRAGVRPPGVGLWSLFRIAERRERVGFLANLAHFKRARDALACPA